MSRHSTVCLGPALRFCRDTGRPPWYCTFAEWTWYRHSRAEHQEIHALSDFHRPWQHCDMRDKIRCVHISTGDKKKNHINRNTFIFSNSMSFHLSIDTDRTNDKCTPRPRCFPEHSKQIHIPYVTDTHCGLCVPHSKHFYWWQRQRPNRKWLLVAHIDEFHSFQLFSHTVFSLVGRNSCKMRLVRGLAIFHSTILPTTHFNTHTQTQRLVHIQLYLQIESDWTRSEFNWETRLFSMALFFPSSMLLSQLNFNTNALSVFFYFSRKINTNDKLKKEKVWIEKINWNEKKKQQPKTVPFSH